MGMQIFVVFSAAGFLFFRVGVDPVFAFELLFLNFIFNHVNGQKGFVK
jgi:hypothetical protein